ncbi:hypothetical protein YC2023_042278 [Brassica napus]
MDRRIGHAKKEEKTSIITSCTVRESILYIDKNKNIKIYSKQKKKKKKREVAEVGLTHPCPMVSLSSTPVGLLT